MLSASDPSNSATKFVIVVEGVKSITKSRMGDNRVKHVKCASSFSRRGFRSLKLSGMIVRYRHGTSVISQQDLAGGSTGQDGHQFDHPGCGL